MLLETRTNIVLLLHQSAVYLQLMHIAPDFLESRATWSLSRIAPEVRAASGGSECDAFANSLIRRPSHVGDIRGALRREAAGPAILAIANHFLATALYGLLHRLTRAHLWDLKVVEDMWTLIGPFDGEAPVDVTATSEQSRPLVALE